MSLPVARHPVAAGEACRRSAAVMPAARISLVMLTYGRREEVLSTLARTVASVDCPIVVVDNGSRDGTADAIRQAHPRVEVAALARNLGAAGRNEGVRRVKTEYVAFSDDDTCWQAGALQLAVDILDRHPQAGILNARILVGDNGRLDTASAEMARSPLPGPADVGPEIVGFMAGACVMRTRLFLSLRGYWPGFFIGGEESLLALDAMDAGWRILYAPAVVTRHWPSRHRDSSLRIRMLARNAVWTAAMRLPWAMVWETFRAELRQARARHGVGRFALDALLGVPAVLGRRALVDATVLARLARVGAAA